MKREREGQAGWNDPSHWRGGWLGLYVNGRDRRLWVRKKPPGIGWTLNLGHPRARRVLAGFLVVVVAGILAAAFLDSR